MTQKKKATIDEKAVVKAAKALAKEWAAWHCTFDILLSPELIDAMHGIVEALGLEFEEVDDGPKVRLVKVVKP